MAEPALIYDEFEGKKKYELIGGRVVAMAAPSIRHGDIVGAIYVIFKNYLRGKRCRVFCGNTSVILSDKDEYKPDVSIVCDPSKIKLNNIVGAPDLVVEVLSRSTGRNDRTLKKGVYERSGVKEYWIIEPKAQSIEIYLLKSGRYELENFYVLESDEAVAEMDDDERAGYITEFKCSLFDDLIIKLADIFENN